MWSLEDIERINKQAAEEQLARGAETLPIESLYDLFALAVGISPVPHIGELVADSLDSVSERIDTLFVDATGMGDEDDPAMTMRAFLDRIAGLLDEYPEGLRLGVVDAGPFQVYVGIWSA